MQMSTINESPEISLIQRAWDAISRGDLSVLEQELATDARWRAVDDGPWNCEGREEIVETMSRNLAGRVRGKIEETIQDGQRVLVALRPETPLQNDERPLDDGIAYVVVTIRDEKFVELKGCADRAAAKAYLASGNTPAAPVLEGPGPPASVPAPPAHRVSGLIPFVHVDDVQRSIDFYHHLGFTLASVYKYKGTPVWAELESETAQLIVSTDGDPIDPAGQGILFYLYSPELAALREQLLDAGVEAGEILDGTPGPRQQMELADPDGYVLMVAQTELQEDPAPDAPG
jgi:ketosteroid isomerase-like protein/catechol 2,3-dioxygenase-like lactoylglutathione lyase family enzyme